MHFLHIRKTGGSALMRALREADGTTRYPLSLHGHATPLWDVPQGHPVFFVVRDPVSRFVSGFWSRYRKGQPLHYNEWTEDEAAAFARFGSPESLAEALVNPMNKHWADAVHAMNSIRHVSTHLSGWLGSTDYLRRRESDLLWIGRQEDLAADVPALASALGLPAIILPQDPVKAHRTRDRFTTELSPEAAHAIRLWYASDVALLGECERIRLSLPMHVSGYE